MDVCYDASPGHFLRFEYEKELLGRSSILVYSTRFIYLNTALPVISCNRIVHALVTPRRAMLVSFSAT